MHLPTFDRSRLAKMAASALLNAVALAALALVAARWTWEWLAPQAEPASQAVSVAVPGPLAANTLFGSVKKDIAAVMPTGISLRLLGIVAATEGQHGFAVIRLEPHEIRTVREGAEITPGLRLAEVNSNHVILERDGNREMLAWPIKLSAAEATAPRIDK